MTEKFGQLLVFSTMINLIYQCDIFDNHNDDISIFLDTGYCIKRQQPKCIKKCYVSNEI